MTDAAPEITDAERNLKTKAAEFEQTLDRLTQKMQEGAEFVRRFREDTTQFAETVRQPGAVLQPYLEKGVELAEGYVQTYLKGKRSAFESYVTEAAQALEHGTDRFIDRVSASIKKQVEKAESRPMVPAIALFLGGFILGGMAMRQYRGRPQAAEPGAVPGLRRIEGGIATPASSSSAPSGSAG